MPEAPEVEIIANLLQSHLINEKIKKIEIKQQRFLSIKNKIPINSVITKINRKGKVIYFKFSNDLSKWVWCPQR